MIKIIVKIPNLNSQYWVVIWWLSLVATLKMSFNDWDPARSVVHNLCNTTAVTGKVSCGCKHIDKVGFRWPVKDFTSNGSLQDPAELCIVKGKQVWNIQSYPLLRIKRNAFLIKTLTS